MHLFTAYLDSFKSTQQTEIYSSHEGLSHKQVSFSSSLYVLSHSFEFILHARLFWGDAGGNVYILTFWSCLGGGPFGCLSPNRRITLAQFLSDIQIGHTNKYHVQKLNRLHLDWVRAIQYLPELDALISSCGESTTALACTALQDLKSKYFIVNKGVICFDYSTKQNILVSGGVEQNVRGWNPYINTGPIFRLKGTSAVVHLMVNNERDLCISISVDKNVSIFSLKDQTLVQIIPPRSFPKMIGNKPIRSAYFNNDTQVLLVGTTDLSVFIPDLAKEVSMRLNTHESELCEVLFNPLYDLIVSGSNGSTVCVWDIKTGKKKLMFDKAHSSTVYNKEMVSSVSHTSCIIWVE
ncbi:cilia- and flagella-associated protein 337-like [Watersipora subatra]|uniref:cilia- and flagella-associated protein 337-like n=1 Tax=Watersipora subatra TaxID=2589382 RepID=UPI00355BC431